MRIGAGAGEDMCVGRRAGELCFVGEKEGRWAEEGGKDECGLLKLYITGSPLAGRGELAGECLTGDTPGPADEAGRLKFCTCVEFRGGPNGLEALKEVPFDFGCGR